MRWDQSGLADCLPYPSALRRPGIGKFIVSAVEQVICFVGCIYFDFVATTLVVLITALAFSGGKVSPYHAMCYLSVTLFINQGVRYESHEIATLYIADVFRSRCNDFFAKC